MAVAKRNKETRQKRHGDAPKQKAGAEDARTVRVCAFGGVVRHDRDAVPPSKKNAFISRVV
jgi:hypothetical protein